MSTLEQAERDAAQASDRIAALYDRGLATRAQLLAAERALDRAIRARCKGDR